MSWWEKERAPVRVGTLAPRKRCHMVVTACQTTLENEAWAVVGQWSAGPCLELGKVLDPLFEL